MVDSKGWFELYKHPKWQKRRLEVLELAGFSCEDCGAEDKMLHIHHTYYEKGLKPWEYPIYSLHCLCEECHKRAQDVGGLLKHQIGRLELGDHYNLLGYALGLEALSYPNTELDVFTYEVAMGIGDCWGLKPEEIIGALQEGRIDGWGLDELRKSKHPKK